MKRKKDAVNNQNGAFNFIKTPKLGVFRDYLTSYICRVMLLILYKIRLDCFLLFQLTPFLLFSQNSFQTSSDFPFNDIEHINYRHGFAGSDVSWLMQDSKGFIWFITEVGLNRYDGYTMRSYSYNPRDSNSITAGVFWQLVEDKNGVIWFPSSDQGLYSFDPALEKFMRYRNKRDDSNSLMTDRMGPIAIDNEGIIWHSSYEGLERLDPEKKVFAHFDKEKNGFANDTSFTIVVDNRETGSGHYNLWFFNKSPGIDYFDTKKGKVTKHFPFPFPLTPGQRGPTAGSMINGMRNKTIWIGSDDRGIYGFNTEKQEYIFIKMDRKCQNSRHIDGFHGVMEDHKGNLWTTNDNNELVYYDKVNKKFFFKLISYNGVSFISRPPLIIEDNSHKVWLGTTNGLLTVDTKFKKISSSQYAQKNSAAISINSVHRISKLNDKQLLICTDAVEIFDKKTKSFSKVSLSENGKPLNVSGIWNSYMDSKGIIWFSGYPGIISYDPVTKKARRYNFYNDSGSLYSNVFLSVIEDNKGRYWAANWFSNGLYSFDPITGKANTFTVESHPHALTSNSLSLIYKDSKGIFYIAGLEGGFITFNPDNQAFKVYHHDVRDPTSVSNETMTFFHEGRNGLIWFGSVGGGLSVFNPESQKFKAFTVDDGLSHNVVTAFTEDKKGNYWIGTSKGIGTFTPPDDPFSPKTKITFRNYDESDGMTSANINIDAAYCDDDGTLYFGTKSAGLIYFHPDDLTNNDFVPPVFITDFSLMNKIVKVSVAESNKNILNNTIEFTKEVFLNYAQNTFSFTFAALNYIHPEKNKYAYKLEGFDKDWIYTDASKRFASYTNLDPGEYTFKVKASNNDGLWNETPTELRITIQPPFWQTLWFKILVGAVAIGIAYAFYRYRVAQIILLQRIRNKIAADLHDDIGST